MHPFASRGYLGYNGLVRQRRERGAVEKLKADFTKLQRAFNPRCIAVVGDKLDYNFMWFRALSTFGGKLYSVQIDPRSIERVKALGVENYTSLLDIPEPIDLVIVAVPRAVAPKILEDCISKGVAAAEFFTSGFAETNTKEGRRLQNLLAERAKKANFHLIGPNCMGIFNPKIGVRQSHRQYAGFGGSVGFISQSGTLAITFSIEAHLQGVDINQSVSFGNGIVLDSTDYLDYFGHDADIKAIGMYLEGVRDGRRFLSVLREVSARKPVVIWQGGQTEAGERAIASHTGSLAMPQAIWDAVIRQSGAIKVTSLEELIDTLKTLLYLAPVYGNRVALVGGSGGESVTITDAFIKAGLEVPLLTQESYKKLATFFNLVGASHRNPIDPGINWTQIRSIMEIVEQDPNIDNITLLMFSATRLLPPQLLENHINTLINMSKNCSKPVLAVVPYLSSSEDMKQAKDIAQKFQGSGIPAFDNVERAARALKNAWDYYSFRSSIVE
jgi:acyl-CoA synthetase (NDP forming)